MRLWLRCGEPEDIVFLCVASGWCSVSDIVSLRKVCRELHSQCGVYLNSFFQSLHLHDLDSLKSSELQRSLLAHCSNLTRIEIDNCPLITDAILEDICSKFGSSLRSILIKRCPLITAKVLGKLSSECLHLEELDTDIEFADALEGLYKSRSKRLTPLRKLGIHGTNDAADSFLVESIDPFLNELEALSLDSIYLPVLLELFADRRRLKKVKITNCFSQASFDRSYQIAEFSEELVSRWTMPELEDLHLEGFLATDALLHRISRQREKLKSLHIGEQARMSNLKSIGERCTNLEQVIVDGCSRLGDTGFHLVATKCQTLRVVKLRNCPGISRTTVDRLADHCKHLRELDLSGCSMIDDNVASGLSRLVRLESLDLSGCRAISNDGLKKICKGCPGLRRLNLANCTGITDEGALAIARWTKYMLCVDLSWCLFVTPLSLEEIIRECTALHQLVLLGCLHIPETEAVMLANSSFGRLELRMDNATFTGRAKSNRFRAPVTDNKDEGKKVKKKRLLGRPTKKDLAKFEQALKNM